jgi:hypothetical protein
MSRNLESPLALAVLSEEFRSLDEGFDALEEALEAGSKRARLKDLLVALDRHLRLEADVFLPVLERVGDVDCAQYRAKHVQLRAAMASMVGDDRQDVSGQNIADLRSLFKKYRGWQEGATFPRAVRVLGSELLPLGYELDEVRQRLKGAYGV